MVGNWISFLREVFFEIFIVLVIIFCLFVKLYLTVILDPDGSFDLFDNIILFTLSLNEAVHRLYGNVRIYPSLKTLWIDNLSSLLSGCKFSHLRHWNFSNLWRFFILLDLD